LPTKSEYEKQDDFVGGAKTAGKFFKAKSGWNSNGNDEDKYGFSALPGGYGGSDGDFYLVGSFGYWWSASENNSNGASCRYMYYSNEGVGYSSSDKGTLFSVRCVQD